MTPQKINRLTALLLLLGLGSALVIYLTAEPVLIDPLLGEPLTTKKYVHELKVIGGQANVFAAEFQDWWSAQWAGEKLARSVAVLTVVLTLAFRFIALHPDNVAAAPPADRKPPAPPGAA